MWMLFTLSVMIMLFFFIKNKYICPTNKSRKPFTDNSKICITGHPQSGKTTFIQNFIKKMNATNKRIFVIRDTDIQLLNNVQVDELYETRQIELEHFMTFLEIQNLFLKQEKSLEDKIKIIAGCIVSQVRKNNPDIIVMDSLFKNCDIYTYSKVLSKLVELFSDKMVVFACGESYVVSNLIQVKWTHRIHMYKGRAIYY